MLIEVLILSLWLNKKKSVNSKHLFRKCVLNFFYILSFYSTTNFNLLWLHYVFGQGVVTLWKLQAKIVRNWWFNLQSFEINIAHELKHKIVGLVALLCSVFIWRKHWNTCWLTENKNPDGLLLFIDSINIFEANAILSWEIIWLYHEGILSMLNEITAAVG